MTAAKDVLRGVVATMRKINTANANPQELELLRDHVASLCRDVLEPLRQRKEEDIPSYLKGSLLRLSNNLATLLKPFEGKFQRNAVSLSITANEDKDDLASLAKGIEFAVAEFVVGAYSSWKVFSNAQ